MYIFTFFILAAISLGVQVAKFYILFPNKEKILTNLNSTQLVPLPTFDSPHPLVICMKPFKKTEKITKYLHLKIEGNEFCLLRFLSRV